MTAELTGKVAATLRVLVVDDQELVRSGFSLVLGGCDDLQVVGEAADGAAAVRAATLLVPDVVLMDIRMPGMDGIEATRRIVAQLPQVRVLVLTTFDLEEYVYAALRAGASGFLLKSAPPARLTEAVRVVAGGDALLDPAVTRNLVAHYVSAPRAGARLPDPLAPLTEREAEVLRLIAGGLSNSEIGTKLFIAEGTVKTHVNRLLSKLGLRDRVQAVVLAYETGMVRPGSRI